MWVFPDTHHSTTYWLFKTTLITCRRKMIFIVLCKTQESFRKAVSLCDHAIKFGERFLACVKTWFDVSLHSLMLKSHNLYWKEGNIRQDRSHQKLEWSGWNYHYKLQLIVISKWLLYHCALMQSILSMQSWRVWGYASRKILKINTLKLHFGALSEQHWQGRQVIL